MQNHQPVRDFHPTLRHPERQAIGGALQSVLIDLIDLSLLGKQLHWAVEGPSFRPLHLHLDELVSVWRELADQVAERAVALGVTPNGQVATVAAASKVAAVPSEPLSDRVVVSALTHRVTDVVYRVRARMEQVAEYDRVSEDLLIQVVASLEKQLWMIRAQHELVRGERGERDLIDGPRP
jgi:starvation-inducible DNA-binding protein